jgi:UPF0735 ACT domain-containing protein cphy_3604
LNEESRYYVLKEKAVPEVLLKVVEAKRLLNADKYMTVKEATDKVDISRSSFYKYKDDIFPFDDNTKGRIITLAMEVLDRAGLLSDILSIVAKFKANILTIHQSIPVGGLANVSLSIEVLKDTGKISEMVGDIKTVDGIYDVKILARE